jgi:hypothetical protein
MHVQLHRRARGLDPNLEQMSVEKAQALCLRYTISTNTICIGSLAVKHRLYSLFSHALRRRPPVTLHALLYRAYARPCGSPTRLRPACIQRFMEYKANVMLLFEHAATSSPHPSGYVRLQTSFQCTEVACSGYGSYTFRSACISTASWARPRSKPEMDTQRSRAVPQLYPDREARYTNHY